MDESIKKRYAKVSAVSDAFIILGLIAATLVLHGVLIPYITRTYGLAGSAAETTDMAEYMFSGAGWFRTSLSGYDMPEYKWYIVLMIAFMVQNIADEILSRLQYGTIDYGGRVRGFLAQQLISVLVVSPVITAFMLQLTLFFILSICPQNVPLLFMAGEILVFCLPGLVRKYLIEREFSLFSLLFSLAQVGLLYKLSGSDSPVLKGILFLMVLIQEYLDNQPLTADEMAESGLPGAVPAVFYGIWVIVGVVMIRPVVYTHMPELQKTMLDVYCKDVMVEEYDALYLRSDGCLADSGNNVIFENVRQKASCCGNDLFLTEDGLLQVYDGPGTEPLTLMENVSSINAFADALLVIGNDGTVYGFGDFGNYLPGEPCYQGLTAIAKGKRFVQGDLGKDHILLLTDKGDLYSMGCNPSGELGTGDRSMSPQGLRFVMAGVRTAKAGYGTSYALTEGGELYAWGRNDLGQLGTGVHIPSFKTGKGYAVNDGLIWAAGPQLLSFTEGPIEDVEAGVTGAFALDAEGNVWAWGAGVTKECISEPVQVRSDIKKIRACEYVSGLSPMSLYLIRSDDTAVRITSSDSRSFRESIVEVVFDAAAWMPEPIEEVSTKLEDLLDRFNVRTEKGPEPEEISGPEGPLTASVLEPAVSKRHDCSWFKEFGGHTYRIYDEFLYMKNAQTHCEAMGGHLATVTSKEELDFLCSILKEQNDVKNLTSTFHIGLTYGGQYAWITGEDPSFVNANHAKQTYDSENGEGCLRTDGRMNVGMPLRMPYICEWD